MPMMMMMMIYITQLRLKPSSALCTNGYKWANENVFRLRRNWCSSIAVVVLVDAAAHQDLTACVLPMRPETRSEFTEEDVGYC